MGRWMTVLLMWLCYGHAALVYNNRQVVLPPEMPDMTFGGQVISEGDLLFVYATQLSEGIIVNSSVLSYKLVAGEWAYQSEIRNPALDGGYFGYFMTCNNGVLAIAEKSANAVDESITIFFYAVGDDITLSHSATFDSSITQRSKLSKIKLTESWFGVAFTSISFPITAKLFVYPNSTPLAITEPAFTFQSTSYIAESINFDMTDDIIIFPTGYSISTSFYADGWQPFEDFPDQLCTSFTSYRNYLLMGCNLDDESYLSLYQYQDNTLTLLHTQYPLETEYAIGQTVLLDEAFLLYTGMDNMDHLIRSIAPTFTETGVQTIELEYSSTSLDFQPYLLTSVKQLGLLNPAMNVFFTLFRTSYTAEAEYVTGPTNTIVFTIRDDFGKTLSVDLASANVKVNNTDYGLSQASSPWDYEAALTSTLNEGDNTIVLSATVPVPEARPMLQCTAMPMNSITKSFTLDVTKEPLAVVVQVDETMVEEGDIINVTVAVKIENDLVSKKERVLLPAWGDGTIITSAISFDPNTGEYKFAVNAPSTPGNHDIKVRVGAVTGEQTILVKDPPEESTPPEPPQFDHAALHYDTPLVGDDVLVVSIDSIDDEGSIMATNQIADVVFDGRRYECESSETTKCVVPLALPAEVGKYDLVVNTSETSQTEVVNVIYGPISSVEWEPRPVHFPEDLEVIFKIYNRNHVQIRDEGLVLGASVDGNHVPALLLNNDYKVTASLTSKAPLAHVCVDTQQATGEKGPSVCGDVPIITPTLAFKSIRKQGETTSSLLISLSPLTMYEAVVEARYPDDTCVSAGDARVRIGQADYPCVETEGACLFVFKTGAEGKERMEVRSETLKYSTELTLRIKQERDILGWLRLGLVILMACAVVGAVVVIVVLAIPKKPVS